MLIFTDDVKMKTGTGSLVLFDKSKIIRDILQSLI